MPRGPWHVCSTTVVTPELGHILAGSRHQGWQEAQASSRVLLTTAQRVGRRGGLNALEMLLTHVPTGAAAMLCQNQNVI